jgi:hypothetical protein
MDSKHRVGHLLGIAALLSGFLLGLLQLLRLASGHITDAWDAIDIAFLFACPRT